jgi:exonuclease VII small subunit
MKKNKLPNASGADMTRHCQNDLFRVELTVGCVYTQLGIEERKNLI